VPTWTRIPRLLTGNLKGRGIGRSHAGSAPTGRSQDRRRRAPDRRGYHSPGAASTEGEGARPATRSTVGLAPGTAAARWAEASGALPAGRAARLHPPARRQLHKNPFNPIQVCGLRQLRRTVSVFPSFFNTSRRKLSV